MGALGPQEAVTVVRTQGLEEATRALLGVRGSELTHLDSQGRCLSTCHPDQHFL